MKRTYIFRITDNRLCNSRLLKLVRTLNQTTTVSWKFEGNADRVTQVQCFVDGPTIYQIVAASGINPDLWDDIISEARANGDEATGQASKKLDALRKKATPELKLAEARDYWQSRVEDARKELREAEETLLKSFRERLEFVEDRLDYIHRQQFPGGTKRSKRSA